MRMLSVAVEGRKLVKHEMEFFLYKSLWVGLVWMIWLYMCASVGVWIYRVCACDINHFSLCVSPDQITVREEETVRNVH